MLRTCTLLSFLSWSYGVQLPTKSSTPVRVFHPAFPNFLTQSVASEEIQRLINVKEMLRQSRDEQPSDFSLLPWKVFPALGINDLQVVFSKSQIEESYEKHKHNGYFLWAEKLEKPEKGCILLNHWSQKAILLSEYDVERGARGYELRSSSGTVDSFIWPPLALEHELTEKNTRWQPVRVSDNIANGEVFTALPDVMVKSAWELIFLLLISPEKNEDIYQALFDTGLCPRQGLIAYIRLLQQVQHRAEAWEGIPYNLKIKEREVLM